MNLKFKSSEPDLKFNLQSQLRIINGNILYLTREIDKLVRLTKHIANDNALQTQVDKYFDEDSPHDTPEVEKFEDKEGDIKWSSSQE